MDYFDSILHKGAILSAQDCGIVWPPTQSSKSLVLATLPFFPWKPFHSYPVLDSQLILFTYAVWRKLWTLLWLLIFSPYCFTDFGSGFCKRFSTGTVKVRSQGNSGVTGAQDITFSDTIKKKVHATIFLRSLNHYYWNKKVTERHKMLESSPAVDTNTFAVALFMCSRVRYEKVIC